MSADITPCAWTHPDVQTSQLLATIACFAMNDPIEMLSEERYSRYTSSRWRSVCYVLSRLFSYCHIRARHFAKDVLRPGSFWYSIYILTKAVTQIVNRLYMSSKLCIVLCTARLFDDQEANRLCMWVTPTPRLWLSATFWCLICKITSIEVRVSCFSGSPGREMTIVRIRVCAASVCVTCSSNPGVWHLSIF